MYLSRLVQIAYAVICALVIGCILVSTFFTNAWSELKVYESTWSVGFFRAVFCDLDNCVYFERKPEDRRGLHYEWPHWLKAVFAFMILALVVAIVAFIWDCVTFRARFCRDHLLHPLPVLAGLCALLLIIALTIYGVKHSEETRDFNNAEMASGSSIRIVFGHSYYIAIVGIILSLINVVVGTLGVCKGKTRI